MATAAAAVKDEAPATKFAKDQLKAIIERIERLEEEKKTISDDIRDVYAEAKGNGFDVKATCALIHSAPTGRRPIVPLRRSLSMSGIDFVHCSQLLGRCGSLKFFLPGLIRHAVDSLAALILAHRDALGVSFFLEPVGQAVATEARQVHQVDVLNVGTTAQMLYKPPKRSGFKFCSGFVVDRHTNSALPCMTQKGHAPTVGRKLSHIFPHRDANIQTAFMGLV